MACGADAVTCPAGPIVSGTAQPVTLTQVTADGTPTLRVEVGGQTSDVPLTGTLAGWSLPTDQSGACCLHDCCGTPD